MPTAVPAVDRAAAVLALLADRPFGSTSLSDIARGTGIHKATCAAILTTLTNHGLVSRDSERQFTLGPDLVRLGHAYRERHRGLVVGRREMWQLADTVGLSCSATVLDGDDMVILDIFGDTHPPHLPHRVGRRIPLAPPMGTIFKAWGGEAEIDEWLEQMQHEFDGDRASQYAVVSAIRARGFALGSEQDFNLSLEAALRRLERKDSDARGLAIAMMVADKIRNYQDPVSDRLDEPVNYLVGPVFGHDQRVIMSVNLYGKPGEMRRRDLPRLGPQLIATTEKITQMIGGVRPAEVHVQYSGLPGG